ncbi:uncharacterized protein LOC129565663 [Sitodiplosis mosellana]|uniref:uncharacterized protein LOC129565663 n=1 Tax=Sitodiplosis mosellana TaxID=263140 RepID=UPI002443F262|nr:uncharacterized protein LOC129565663 [Sitodiplosis mosellana]
MAVTKQRFDLKSWIQFGGRYIYPNQHDDEKYIEICSKQVDRSMRNFLIRLAVMLAMEIAMEMVIVVMYTVPKLIEYEFQKLDEKLKESRSDMVNVHRTFRNIVQQIMDTDYYAMKISDGWYWRSFSAPIAFTYGIAMSIFCEYTMNFMAGYFSALISYLQLYYLCAAADTFSNDGTCEILYEIKWYVLPIKFQKDIMHLINRRQNKKSLSVGPFADLNIETFYDISKRIYSFIMFLLNFFD